LDVKFKGSSTSSNIAFNTGPGVIKFYSKVHKGQIVNNTDVTFKFKRRVYNTIITQNIIPHNMDVRSKCSIIKNNILNLGC
jgi:predicted oxidoreductase